MIPVILIHPDPSIRVSEAEKILSQNKLSRNHPDVLWFEENNKLGVEQARQIKEFLTLKPYQADKHVVIIISAENLTSDAQNTLLKTLEEPIGETIFIMGASSEDQLLPTILSRCQIINLTPSELSQNETTHKYDKDIEKLLEANTETRFQFIEKLKERDEFLPALTAYFRHKLLEKSAGGILVPPPGWTIERLQNFLKDLMEAEKWTKSNVNIRAILEYLMLKMPAVKTS